MYHWCEISKKTKIKNIGRKGDQDIDEFITYCEKIVKEEDFYLTAYHDHIISQHKFIYDDNDKLVVDKVFHFEKYNEVEQMLKERCGVIMKHALDTKGTYDRSYCLTRAQKNRVYDMYEKDFELLGYNR